MVTNAANEDQLAKAAKAEVRDENDFISSLQKVMATTAGRRVFEELFDFCGVDRVSFTGNSHTFFNEGGRNVGLWAQKLLREHCLGDYLVLLRNSQR